MRGRAAPAAVTERDVAQRKIQVVIDFLKDVSELQGQRDRIFWNLLHACFQRMARSCNGAADAQYDTARQTASFFGVDVSQDLDRTFAAVVLQIRSMPGFDAVGLDWGDPLMPPRLQTQVSLPTRLGIHRP